MLIFMSRIIGAALLRPEAYEDVEADRSSLWQAIVVVLFSAVAAGVGFLSIRLGQFRGLLYASSAAALVIGGVWLVGR